MPRPIMNMPPAASDNKPVIVKLELISLIGLLLDLENLNSPQSNPKPESKARRPAAEIMAEAIPTASAEYSLAAIIQKTKPNRALPTVDIIR